MKRERLKQILAFMEDKESVGTIELTRQFGVSEMTVRRDLIELERQGRIRRFHGGASLRKGEELEASFDVRVQRNRELKIALGRRGVRYLEDHLPGEAPRAVFIGSGSTLYCMAKLMSAAANTTLVTDNVYVSSLLASNPNNTVVAVGGQILLPSLNATGFMAEKMIAEFVMDYAFISSSAIDGRGNLYTYNLLEAGTFSAVIAASKHIVVLADHSKLGKHNLVHLCRLNEKFTLITDSGAPEPCLSSYRELGCEVLLAQVPESLSKPGALRREGPSRP